MNITVSFTVDSDFVPTIASAIAGVVAAGGTVGCLTVSNGIIIEPVSNFLSGPELNAIKSARGVLEASTVPLSVPPPLPTNNPA